LITTLHGEKFVDIVV